jgi:hypothetical protein
MQDLLAAFLRPSNRVMCACVHPRIDEETSATTQRFSSRKGQHHGVPSPPLLCLFHAFRSCSLLRQQEPPKRGIECSDAEKGLCRNHPILYFHRKAKQEPKEGTKASPGIKSTTATNTSSPCTCKKGSAS